ncbi:ORF6N domain-containing protein [Paracoccus haematequi]|nr:ORF6N domain-containing protein [Paracoccus haematequi]
MNLPVVQIADTQVQQIAYKGEPVVTFAMVDEIHQRADGTAGRNFRENRDRFDEGRDFIRISADEIRRHKIMEISSKAHGDVVLLTERGYLKLVKPMQDDRAWEVQGEMIDCYFKVKNAEPLDRPIMSTALSREARLQFKQSLWLAKQCKLDGNQAILSANHATRVLTGVDMMGLIGVSRVEAPDDHQDINPSEIGNRLGGFKAVAVNRMLCDHGYQVQFRDYKGRPYYELTDKGRAAGARMKDTKKKHDNGTPVLQLMWSSRIVDALRGDLEGASA